ncbi:MAG: HEPN domain-containing protein [Neisseria sp.]|uniref:HEPN domain-containing protein n=1 Tax=Neisseria sp. TaxID=192066 RepID=UPI0026DB4A83|nr:HEPN domain-containing protein [Neisseria sp.]MDO4641301.1 HEPN domain-containing protein [Neisseria sp.]
MQSLNNLQRNYRAHRHTYPEPFRLRIHRALSWLGKAQVELSEDMGLSEKDLDTGFIILWIAFNAVYAKDTELLSIGDRGSFRDFLNTICRLDNEKRLYSLVWGKFSSSIRLLLDNRYVFQPFWDFHNGKISETVWLDQFSKAKKKAHRALVEQDTESVLSVVFDRLYTLRNQIVHGGATYASSSNRRQLQDACAFLGECVMLIVEVMLQYPDHQIWGKPFYPYVKED